MLLRKGRSMLMCCRHHYKDNAMEVLQFAVKYNHVDIMDLVAPHTIGEDISTIRDTLPGHLLIPWVRCTTRGSLSLY